VTGLAVIAVLGMVLVGCNKGTTSSAPTVDGAVGFDVTQATALNGPIPSAEPGIVCGSQTDAFGTELLKKSPLNARVRNEWGEVVPGHLMAVSGTIAKIVFSSGDLTFTHPFNVDFTFDVTPDPPFQKLAQLIGVPAPAGPLGTLHMEIEEGLLPHTNSLGVGNYLPGWIPSVGDHVAAWGLYIIDCGHTDFHTEIHPTTFLAFSHTDGKTTTVHTFFNPYRESQLYNPDPNLVNQVNDNTRFANKDTKPFPPALVDAILRIGGLGEAPFKSARQLSVHMVEMANTESPPPLYVCAPGAGKPGFSGGAEVSYNLTIRPGVSLTPNADAGSGCASFDLRIHSNYKAAIPVRHDCAESWDTLNKQAQLALGDSTVDIRAGIEKQAPSSFKAGIDQNPIVDCYDPLVAPSPGDPALGTGQHVSTNASQPFPFYGWIKVTANG